MNNLIYSPNNVVNSAHDDKWKMKLYSIVLPGTTNFGATGDCESI